MKQKGMTRDDLTAFEKEVARRWENGEIKAPVHLSGGNESQLIEIFKDIKQTDWVLSTWRSHYHALLHGIHPGELMRQILAGKSMSVNSVDPPFYSSAIAGGILPVAVGLGMAIKKRGEDRKIWCFVGDTTFEMGIAHEAIKYSKNFKLPVTFVVECNGISVKTPTAEIWALEHDHVAIAEILLRWIDGGVIRYCYKLTQEHHGTGKWIPF